MTRFKKLCLIFSLLLIVLATTGEQCDVNTLLFGENEEYRAIRDVVNRFKEGINSLDKEILNDVISKNYASGGLDRLGIIKNYFDQEIKISDIRLSNITVDGRGADCRVDWDGTVILKPKPDIPYVADKIPTLSGDIDAAMIFGFKKEDDGKWRIIAKEVLTMTKSAKWGISAPFISRFTVTPSTASAGDSLWVDAELKRIGGNVMLAAVNDRTLINTIYGIKDGPIDTIKVRVPSDQVPGSTYDVYIIALGVNANFLNPSQSGIVGITLRQISVPIEK